MNPNRRTVRELGGEIFGELIESLLRSEGPSNNLNFDPQGEILTWATDIIIGVIARYEGYLITRDDDWPATALPRHWPAPEEPA